jgi:N-acetylneuraminic acid mutarotase
MPAAEYGGAADSDASAVYVAGGWSSLNPFSELATLYKYVPSTDTWSSLNLMPDRNGGASAVYYPPANKLFVFGGEIPLIGKLTPDGGRYEISAKTRIYDIASDTWTVGQPMPDGRKYAASGYDPGNGKIYVVGGTGINVRNTTWEYDPMGNTWTVKAPIPHSVAGAGFGIVNGHLYVAGDLTPRT